MASGWNLWVWLECIGVASGCCCKEVYRFPHNITYLVIAHFLQLHPPTSLLIKNVLFFCILYVAMNTCSIYSRVLELVCNIVDGVCLSLDLLPGLLVCSLLH